MPWPSFQDILLPLCHAGILLLLLVLAVIDLRIRRLPHALTALLAGLALLRAWLDGDSLWGALGSGLMVALPFWLLRRLRTRRARPGRPPVGGGDVRFAFAIGCLVGAGPGLLAAAAATAALALAGLAARLAGTRAAALPLGPFLALPVILLVLLGHG